MFPGISILIYEQVCWGELPKLKSQDNISSTVGPLVLTREHAGTKPECANFTQMSPKQIFIVSRIATHVNPFIAQVQDINILKLIFPKLFDVKAPRDICLSIHPPTPLPRICAAVRTRKRKCDIRKLKLF